MKTASRRHHKHPGGRPPKFGEPARPITVTLPERVLDRLQVIDEDRAKAIVKAVDSVLGLDDSHQNLPAVIEMSPGTGILIVPPSRALRSLGWLTMIEIAPARFLIAIDSGTPIEKLELALFDLLDTARRTMPDEVRLLESLRKHLASLRRDDRIAKAEIFCVTPQS